MPFKREQAILEKLLPRVLYRLIYNIALFILRITRGMIDDIYFIIMFLICLINGGDCVEEIKTIRRIRPFTMVGRHGLIKTYDIAESIELNNIPGCFVECGVARGGCSALMALVAFKNGNSRHTWLFDSFEGMGQPSPEDEYKEPIRYKTNKRSDIVSPGYCLGTYREVEKLLFNKLKLDRNNISIIKGWFDNTLPKYRAQLGQISLLRIDCDWYEPTKSCLENLYDNVISSGFIIIDDYNSYPGAKKATDEFLESRKLDIKKTFDNRGGCYMRKGSS